MAADEEITFCDVLKNHFHVEEIKRSSSKRCVNRSLVKKYIALLSRSIDIEDNDININNVTDILLNSINCFYKTEEEFDAYCGVSVNFMPMLIKKNIFFNAMKWITPNELGLFLSDSFSSRVYQRPMKQKPISFEQFTSSRYNATRLFCDKFIDDVNKKIEYLKSHLETMKKISIIKRYIDNVDNNIMKIEFKFCFEFVDKLQRFVILNEIDSQICNKCVVSFVCLNSETLECEHVLSFDINLSCGIMRYNSDLSRDIHKFNIVQLNYIFNQWINHMIYPGFNETCRFVIYNSSKRKPIQNTFFVCMMYQNRLERSYVFHHNISCLWILNYDFFDNVKYCDFNVLFNPTHIDNISLEFKKKKKCYNHSRDIVVDKNGYIYANKGVLFIDREHETFDDPFFERWFELHNMIYECHCKDEPGINTSFKNAANSLSKNKINVDEFFEDMFFKDFCTLDSHDFLLTDTSIKKQDIVIPKMSQIDIVLFVLKDLPSNGGIVTHNSINFPTIQIVEENIYSVVLNTSFLPATVVENHKYTKFYIWYEQEDHRKKVIFERELVCDSGEFVFSIPQKSGLTKLCYGEIDQTIWGFCEVYTREQYMDNSIGFSLFINDRYVPDVVLKSSLEEKIDQKIETNLNGLRFLPEASSSFVSEKIKKYVFFILEPYTIVDDKNMIEKMSRNLIYTNPYAQNSMMKTFVIRYAEVFEGEFKNCDEKCSDIGEFIQLSPDLFEYSFYYVYHRKIISALPGAIPSSLDFTNEDDGVLRRINVNFFKDVTIDNGIKLPIDACHGLDVYTIVSPFSEKRKISQIKIV